MLKLVRYQKRELPIAVGCEEIIYSSSRMFAAERKNREALGVLADKPVYNIPYSQIRKIAALKYNGSESYLGIVKKEKSDIVKIVNQSGTHLRWSLSFVFLQ